MILLLCNDIYYDRELYDVIIIEVMKALKCIIVTLYYYYYYYEGNVLFREAIIIMERYSILWKTMQYWEYLLYVCIVILTVLK